MSVRGGCSPPRHGSYPCRVCMTAQRCDGWRTGRGSWTESGWALSSVKGSERVSVKVCAQTLEDHRSAWRGGQEPMSLSWSWSLSSSSGSAGRGRHWRTVGVGEDALSLSAGHRCVPRPPHLKIHKQTPRRPSRNFHFRPRVCRMRAGPTLHFGSRQTWTTRRHPKI